MPTNTPLGDPAHWLEAEQIGRDDAAANTVIADVLRAWEAAVEDGHLPARHRIDPVALGPAALPWVFLLDVLRDQTPLDYRFRLVGEGNVSLVGRNAAGMLVSEIFVPRDRSIVPYSFDLTVETGRPTFWRATVPHDRTETVQIRRAVFPFAENGIDVDALLGCAVPDGGLPGT